MMLLEEQKSAPQHQQPHQQPIQNDCQPNDKNKKNNQRRSQDLRSARSCLPPFISFRKTGRSLTKTSNTEPSEAASSRDLKAEESTTMSLSRPSTLLSNSSLPSDIYSLPETKRKTQNDSDDMFFHKSRSSSEDPSLSMSSMPLEEDITGNVMELDSDAERNIVKDYYGHLISDSDSGSSSDTFPLFRACSSDTKKSCGDKPIVISRGVRYPDAISIMMDASKEKRKNRRKRHDKKVRFDADAEMVHIVSPEEKEVNFTSVQEGDDLRTMQEVRLNLFETDKDVGTVPRSRLCRVLSEVAVQDNIIKGLYHALENTKKDYAEQEQMVKEKSYEVAQEGKKRRSAEQKLDALEVEIGTLTTKLKDADEKMWEMSCMHKGEVAALEDLLDAAETGRNARDCKCEEATSKSNVDHDVKELQSQIARLESDKEELLRELQEQERVQDALWEMGKMYKERISSTFQ
eukprot:11890103-Ditylum_brightwellii.AAC.1